MERIPVAGPWITQKEIDYVTEAVSTAWYANANKFHDRFERAFAEYVGRKHALALPSCTSAIHLTLLALGVGPGDEVIVPDVTWIASAAPVAYVGATPVFADVDPSTWCVTPDSVDACVTPRTRALIAVNLYGGMPDMPGLLSLASRRGFALIEDAAESVGSEYAGRRSGSFGVASVFSFHGSKTLTTGEGGMLLTDDDAMRRRCLILRDHGRNPGDLHFRNAEVAHKYKMSAMQAALGLAQLERIEELLERKREIFSWYAEDLSGFPLSLNAEPEKVKNTYWMVTAVWEASRGVDKAFVGAALSSKGIDTRPFFHPLSSLPAYAGLPQSAEALERNAVAYRLSPYGLNLPSPLNLTRERVRYVCAAFGEALGAARGAGSRC